MIQAGWLCRNDLLAFGRSLMTCKINQELLDLHPLNIARKDVKMSPRLDVIPATVNVMDSCATRVGERPESAQNAISHGYRILGYPKWSSAKFPDTTFSHLRVV